MQHLLKNYFGEVGDHINTQPSMICAPASNISVAVAHSFSKIGSGYK